MVLHQQSVKRCYLIQSIPVIEMNAIIKEIAIKIRQHHRVKLPDSIVAATAIYLKSACITGDSGFKQIKDLDLIFYST
jgi:predicted nucleic acid-binding protein